MNKIIFGGGFDPIHLGHINMAKEASRFLNAEVIFVPAPISIWKKESIPAEFKVEMINLSIEGLKGFSVDLFEINSGKQENYSIDTVRYFKNKYPNDELFYLIGSDQVNNFHKWKDALGLSKLAHIVFFKRPGYDNSLENIDKYHMLAIDSGELLDIDSTSIRNLKSIKVDPKVLRFIEDKKLYFINKISTMMSEKRLAHSISVARLAYDIAKKHEMKDADRVYIAALLHDIGKECPDSKQIMEKYYPEYLDLPKYAYHQFVGEHLAKEIFGVENKEMLSAIRYHCTGNEKMNEIAQIIYAADKIDPIRDYDSSSLIAAMMNNSVQEGFKIVLKANKEFLEEKEKGTQNYLTLKCFKYYLV